jgi:inosine-uridine nucleoside N-ribohydrolase
MGGALDHPGNTSPTAEFNCFADPYAAQSLLDAVNAGAFHMILAPLDITTPHQIPFDDLIHPSYPDNPDPSLTPLKHLTSAMLGRVRGLQASFGLPDAMEMHDPVAVWYAIAHAHLPAGQNEDGWKVRARQFKVERTGELTRGMCVIDRRGGGEGNGGSRTEDKDLADNHIPTAGGGSEAKRDRDGSEIKEASKNEAKIITHTPGSEVLRKLLLKRVFGTEV